MTHSTLVCAEVEHDSDVTSAEAITQQVNTMRPSLHGARMGPFAALASGPSLIIADEYAPTGQPVADSVRMRIVHTPYGIDVVAVSPSGERIAGVAVDFFENELRVLGWNAGSDEPCVVSVLCHDVSAASAANLEPSTAEQPDRAPVSGK